MKGSGKTHLTKVFIRDALREVEANPHAKLIVYEPKRQFYAWLCSPGVCSDKLRKSIYYFMPSDVRSVALDFTRDYEGIQGSQTLANAFYPEDPHEHQRFWGDSLRTIYSQVFDAIRARLGRVDLRLMCLVLEKRDLTQAVLGHDPYYVQAQELLSMVGGTIGETAANILKTVHSRIAQMKVLAAHQEYARRDRNDELFSLDEFLRRKGSGILVVSKDSRFKSVQDPMNGMLFLRLTELLDAMQSDKRRKIFIVIDEFPTLAGDRPCPGITDMFLRLRDRGVTVLVTYQAHTTLKRIYGETATENIGQCTNVIYLKQADVESAKYAAEDLGHEWGYEDVSGQSFGGGAGRESSWGVSRNMQWFDRPRYHPTVLLNMIPKPSKERGLEGRAKSPEAGPLAWPFIYPPEFIDRIPDRDGDIEEHMPRAVGTQWLPALEPEERHILEGPASSEASGQRSNFQTGPSNTRSMDEQRKKRTVVHQGESLVFYCDDDELAFFMKPACLDAMWWWKLRETDPTFRPEWKEALNHRETQGDLKELKEILYPRFRPREGEVFERKKRTVEHQGVTLEFFCNDHELAFFMSVKSRINRTTCRVQGLPSGFDSRGVCGDVR